MVTLEVTGPVPPAVIRQHDNGTIEVLEAPPLAEFSMELLTNPGLAGWIDEAGNLLLAGQIAYRPLRFRQDLAGRVTLICQKVG